MSPKIPVPFLFRFAASLSRNDNVRGLSTMEAALAEEPPVPHFAQLDDACHFADLFAVWNRQGLALRFQIGQPTGAMGQRGTATADREGLQLWIDTRNTKNIHRAGRFCHQFYFPVETIALASTAASSQSSGSEVRAKSPERISISNAREEVPVKLEGIEFRAAATSAGYDLDVWLPMAALHGYDPEASPRLGFYYLLRDPYRGEQFFSVDRAFPFTYDPSLWPTLELVK